MFPESKRNLHILDGIDLDEVFPRAEYDSDYDVFDSAPPKDSINYKEQNLVEEESKGQPDGEQKLATPHWQLALERSKSTETYRKYKSELLKWFDWLAKEEKESTSDLALSYLTNLASKAHDNESGKV